MSYFYFNSKDETKDRIYTQSGKKEDSVCTGSSRYTDVYSTFMCLDISCSQDPYLGRTLVCKMTGIPRTDRCLLSDPLWGKS